ncbi:MAG TPA: bifunctional UDP-N-acetylmuramoyl-tripeptide:D-alanyl-D-alanine ligase/alanine racemase [Fulvivirga sp.]|nr:bifunctional UDP-N-acetylmuramoyl-tripeptide:D-alanyl-D-alanine ligase/alanine racemase [Fulvivirga sp.]
MKFETLTSIIKGKILSLNFNDQIRTLVVDSRKPFITQGALFFAISGPHHDGHSFLQELYDQGVRQFVVEREIVIEGKANIIVVDSAIEALQKVSAFHREQFHIPVIGITGSNGKTIVKEWLFNCLSPFYKIARSPHSYNSQVGVPLSVWSLSTHHDLAIFEAGISLPNEMERLANIIKPTVGIFTNLGAAHDEGFEYREQKLDEKLKLFKSAERVIFNGDDDLIYDKLKDKSICWGQSERCQVQLLDEKTASEATVISIKYLQQQYHIKLPFSDSASIENCKHCIAYMLYEGFDHSTIQERISKLTHLSMRLELKKAVGNSHLIDDSYNNDLGGLQQAAEFLSQQKLNDRKVVILSDILQSGLSEEVLYSNVAEILDSADIDEFIGIGPTLSNNKHLFPKSAIFFPSTEEFLKNFETLDLSKALILVKGARTFTFEKIVKVLEEKIHGTVLEINLNALTNNLNFYRSKVSANTKIMVMVKAFAYGSGSFEIANLMQYHRVDYLGVAYADEGVTLRENGVYLPIMVMNPNEESFDGLVKYSMEPEMFNISLLKKFITFLNGRKAAIHIKLETGMKRLGFEESELDELIELLNANTNITVKSIFSHLAGADEENHNAFSHEQAAKYNRLYEKLVTGINTHPMRHLVNSPGILRFPEYHFDMVRLGIGLYGLDANNSDEQLKLEPIGVLKTVISQIRTVKKGETIGYGRKGKADKPLTIATIAIGYADGFTRAFSNGKGVVWINGQRVSVIGNVCMDMTMIDITGIEAKEGDSVEIFGKHLSIKELAHNIGTIPYEILTNVSQRVKRVYYTQ